MKTTTASLGTAILAILVMAVAAGQEAEERLSNADIVTLVEAGLTPSAIVALIESRGTEFEYLGGAAGRALQGRRGLGGGGGR